MSNNLKEQALLERIGELTKTYENAIADLRVALTNSEEARRQLEVRQDGTPESERQGWEPEPEDDYSVVGEVVGED